MIDVLVPVLGRPGNAQRLVDSFLAFSGPQDAIHFICSPGDDAQIESCLQTGHHTLIVDFPLGRADYARKMNYGFRNTFRPFLFLGSDDIEFTEGWSERAFARMDGNSVVATNDAANQQVKRGQFGTHCLVRRSYVEEEGATADFEPGVLIHEGYDHNFVDRELCHLAEHRNQYAFAKDAIVKHHHPLFSRTPTDATYKRGMSNFHADRKLFYSRAHLWGFKGMKPYELRFVGSKRRRLAAR